MDKSKLLAKRSEEFPTTEVKTPVGVVKVRSLSRAEVLRVRKHSENPAKFEQVLLSFAMVDPKMSEDDIAKWQQVSGPVEIEEVTDAVMEISGLKERADKVAYKSSSE